MKKYRSVSGSLTLCRLCSTCCPGCKVMLRNDTSEVFIGILRRKLWFGLGRLKGVPKAWEVIPARSQMLVRFHKGSGLLPGTG